jgi:hypothetical protein
MHQGSLRAVARSAKAGGFLPVVHFFTAMSLTAVHMNSTN